MSSRKKRIIPQNGINVLIIYAYAIIKSRDVCIVRREMQKPRKCDENRSIKMLEAYTTSPPSHIIQHQQQSLEIVIIEYSTQYLPFYAHDIIFYAPLHSTNFVSLCDKQFAKNIFSSLIPKIYVSIYLLCDRERQ